MANTPDISTWINVLKELYEGHESDEDRIWREYVNECEKLAGLKLTPKPEHKNILADIVYKDNPFLKLIPKDEFKGAILPIPFEAKK